MPLRFALAFALAASLAHAATASAACTEGELQPGLCNALTPAGCCDGSRVVWCDDVGANGPVCALDCAAQGGVCSYVVDGGFFACRDSYEAPPEGVQEGCCQPQCDGRSCGDVDGCGGVCARPDLPCPDGRVCAADGTCCPPQCEGKACGPDGCGLSCGTCACGEACVDGACVFVMCDGRECGFDGCSDDPDACGACPAGQVCGGDFTCCTPDCDGRACGPDGCGGACGYCGCGEACLGGVCVAEHCRQGAVAFECGTDACGLDCGTCAEDSRCVDHACCTPECDGRACGPDGCGGYCGVCDEGSFCLAGQCGPTSDVPGCSASETPGCAGCGCEACVFALDPYCQDSAWDAVCAVECQEECGQACPCVPSCTGKACGDDGCGGRCGDHAGACAGEGEVCFAGACCVPDCTGRACGDDGCGGSCGTCWGAAPVCDAAAGQCVADVCAAMGCCVGDHLIGCSGNSFYAVDCKADDPAFVCGWYAGDAVYAAGYYCGPRYDEQGEVLIDPAGDPSGTHPPACIVEVPNCLGKPCGASDGLGGICACPPGTACHEGVCVGPASCQGKECGDDGMGGSCGECDAPAVCFGYVCCTPDCAGKACGDDGCGGWCGACEPGWNCEQGQCADPNAGCDGLLYEGCCSGSVLRWCEDGAMQQVDCAIDPRSQGPLCGWVGESGYYGCTARDEADPSGQFPRDCGGDCFCLPGECGQNACGEWCACPLPGDQCVEGQCVCTPACGGRECGPDGCDGSCGACAGGTCAEGRCVGAESDAEAGEAVVDGNGPEPVEVVEAAGDAAADPVAPPDARTAVDGQAEPAGGSGGSCTAGASGSPAPLALLSLPGLALVLRRRRLFVVRARSFPLC